ncbi:hypothetical protein QQP08_007675 [Theobroma cacao]|nr:hypothetical protein QQP08_007675 [Theobroma cacao]
MLHCSNCVIVDADYFNAYKTIMGNLAGFWVFKGIQGMLWLWRWIWISQLLTCTVYVACLAPVPAATQPSWSHPLGWDSSHRSKASTDNSSLPPQRLLQAIFCSSS